MNTNKNEMLSDDELSNQNVNNSNNNNSNNNNSNNNNSNHNNNNNNNMNNSNNSDAKEEDETVPTTQLVTCGFRCNSMKYDVDVDGMCIVIFFFLAFTNTYQYQMKHSVRKLMNLG